MDRVIAIASSIGFFISLLFLALLTWHIQSLRTALSACSDERTVAVGEIARSDDSAAVMPSIKIERGAPSMLGARLSATALNGPAIPHIAAQAG